MQALQILGFLCFSAIREGRMISDRLSVPLQRDWRYYFVRRPLKSERFLESLENYLFLECILTLTLTLLNLFELDM